MTLHSPASQNSPDPHHHLPTVPVVAMGPVVVGASLAEGQEALGARKPRGSVSQGITNLEEGAVLGVLLSRGEGGALQAREGASEVGPESAWDSDAYDDDEDSGYVRQQIEDEEWFMLHEVELQSVEERMKALTAEEKQEVQGGKEVIEKAEDIISKGDGPKEKGSFGGTGGERERDREREKEKEREREIPEEEAYFSGEEYYQLSGGRGEGGGGEEKVEDVDGEGTWAGLLGQLGRRSLGEGEEGEERGEEDDEQHMFEARSVGVMSSDMADAGSSIRESLLGSEGDVDSVKGLPTVGSGRPRLDKLSDDEEEENEEEGDENDGEGEVGKREIAKREKGHKGKDLGEELVSKEGLGVEAEIDVEKDGGVERKPSMAVEREYYVRKSSRRKLARGKDGELGKDKGSFKDIVGQVGGERDEGREDTSLHDGFGFGGFPSGGLGGGDGFSFPSPSSADGLSRMGSGRSMWSVGDNNNSLGEHSLAEVVDEFEANPAADDTLASWKRRSGSSSPIVSQGGHDAVDEASDRGNFTDEGGSFSGDLEAEKREAEREVEEIRVMMGGGEKSGEERGGGKRAAEKEKRGSQSQELAESLELGSFVEREGEDVEELERSCAVVEEELGGEKSQVEEAEDAKEEETTKKALDYEDEFETFNLKIIHRRNRTGFEEEKDFPVVLNSVVAGRYYVTEYLGSAAFSKAIQAHDLHTGMDVCMKIIKNNKDFFDQSLDEVKLLKYINRHDPADQHHLLRLYDYFYHREHLFIICELLRANLYEFHKYNRESGGEVYFTMFRLQSIAKQILRALKFMHSLGLIHCDLKPENILVKSYSRCEVKVIDLGSSCFQTDHLCSYVQSRSYRAPEVILGLPYGPKIDIWSLGCILAELCSGQVLFQNDSLGTLLARVVGIIGPIDPLLLAKGRDTHKYFTRARMLYERNSETDQLEYLIPKKTSLKHRLPMGDAAFVEFVGYLLQVDPARRPTAAEALQHPWFKHQYDAP